ncbi:uncharacterized protein Z518_07152 [Rhinocladiella mackenziei CBS 650.93]|uniref:Uncharacterized protein n=1 Tax=Rhinocladiella mackenziei CBS 650.93 TaxID=1442369 RepID=A0A0D2ICM5_9EURO|nr:uncharacterized protein Z518_07152 [Rhinocladiella mackenziei CBS 650.93]KIX03599.1 hypothetical protein Z518_07152 [Rhinocladiella mackenziei CBS 650.93]
MGGFMFVHQPPKASSQRDIELQNAKIRAHAARISHSRKVKKPKATKGLRLPINIREHGEGHDKDRTIQQREPIQTPSMPPERYIIGLLARIASLRSVLNQYKRDPFNSDPVRNLPLIALEFMDFAYEILWPMNMPGLELAAVKAEMISRRRLAVQSTIEFHCQVSNMATLAFNFLTDPDSLDIINRIRMIHQNMAIKLICQELESLRGPPSELLIQRVVLLDVQGAEPYENWDVQIHPESPLVAANNLKAYYRFQAVECKVKPWRMLTQEIGGISKVSAGLARRLQTADVSTAIDSGTQPFFPLLPETAPQDEYELDAEALVLQTRLGSSLHGIWRAPHTRQIHAVIDETCSLTVRLDQCHHRSTKDKHERMLQISSAALCLQHKLYSLPVELPPNQDLELEDYLFDACRLAIMVYNDMVLWPIPWAAGVKPRLARRLRCRLCPILSLVHDDGTGRYTNLLLWLLLMGGIAATYTTDRTWYVEQLSTYRMIVRCPTWADFKQRMQTFLWWSSVLDDPAFKLWTEILYWDPSQPWTEQVLLS